MEENINKLKRKSDFEIIYLISHAIRCITRPKRPSLLNATLRSSQGLKYDLKTALRNRYNKEFTKNS